MAIPTTIPVTMVVLVLPVLLLLFFDPALKQFSYPKIQFALHASWAETHEFGHLGSTRTRPNRPSHAAATNPPLRPPPAMPCCRRRHDVFLNFRGPDVRHNFADHLYSALVRKGIKAFRDDCNLPRGQSITEAIPRAIEESKLSIVVLSRGYASSVYCLDELVKIMQAVKEKGHQAFPVFYRLTPDDVVHHQSSGWYMDDFDRHKSRYSYERVDSWSRALTDIADIAGWVLPTDRSEAVTVERIARYMACKVQELDRASNGGKLQPDDTTPTSGGGEPAAATGPPPAAGENIERGPFVTEFLRPDQPPPYAGDNATPPPPLSCDDEIDEED